VDGLPVEDGWANRWVGERMVVAEAKGQKLDELKVCSSAVDQNILRCRDVCVCYVNIQMAATR